MARAARGILSLLPDVEIRPDDVEGLTAPGAANDRVVYWTCLRVRDLYEPAGAPAEDGAPPPFDEEAFERDPGAFRSRLERWAARATVVVNAVRWSPRYPHLLTRAFVRRAFAPGAAEPPRLCVVGDLACDIEGAVEFTVRSSERRHPVYVYDPASGSVSDGWAGPGPVVLAVNRLASEFPEEASRALGDAVAPFAPALARADFSRGLGDLEIPAAFRRAVVVHRGALTPNFRYLNEHLI